MENGLIINRLKHRRAVECVVLSSREGSQWPCNELQAQLHEYTLMTFKATANFAAIIKDDPEVGFVISGTHRGSVSLRGDRTIPGAARKHVRRRMTRRLIRQYEIFREHVKAVGNRVAAKIEDNFVKNVLDSQNAFSTACAPPIRIG